MPAADAPGTKSVRSVGRRLEQLAGESLARALFYAPSPEAIVDAQVALALEHLKDQRELRDKLLRRLLATECELDTLALPLPGYYMQHDPGLRSWVRERLLLVDAERRQVLVDHERRVADLENQLLHLVSQRIMLRGGNAER